VTISTNVLEREPIFYSTTVNDKRQPIDSSCLHRCTAGGDFFDVVIGPDGVVWSAFTDNGQGIVARLAGGPKLR
jgi:streptogramin lyase